MPQITDFHRSIMAYRFQMLLQQYTPEQLTKEVLLKCYREIQPDTDREHIVWGKGRSKTHRFRFFDDTERVEMSDAKISLSTYMFQWSWLETGNLPSYGGR